MKNGTKYANLDFPGPVTPSLVPLMLAREKAQEAREKKARDYDTECKRCGGRGCPVCCPADAQ